MRQYKSTTLRIIRQQTAPAKMVSTQPLGNGFAPLTTSELTILPFLLGCHPGERHPGDAAGGDGTAIQPGASSACSQFCDENVCRIRLFYKPFHHKIERLIVRQTQTDTATGKQNDTSGSVRFLLSDCNAYK